MHKNLRLIERIAYQQVRYLGQCSFIIVAKFDAEMFFAQASRETATTRSAIDRHHTVADATEYARRAVVEAASACKRIRIQRCRLHFVACNLSRY